MEISFYLRDKKTFISMKINSSFHVNNSREDIINDLHSLCKGTFFPRHMSSFSRFFIPA